MPFDKPLEAPSISELDLAIEMPIMQKELELLVARADLLC